MKKKAIIVLVIILAVLLAGFLIYWEVSHGNRQLVDLHNRYQRAVIALPNGEVVDGRISSWLDFDDSDVIQVTIDGKTYLTSYNNVCLISD